MKAGEFLSKHFGGACSDGRDSDRAWFGQANSQLQVQWLAVRQVAYNWPWILGNATDGNFVSPSHPLSLPFLFFIELMIKHLPHSPTSLDTRSKMVPQTRLVGNQDSFIAGPSPWKWAGCSLRSTTSDTRLIISIQFIQSNTYNSSFSHIPLDCNQEASGVKYHEPDYT